MSGGRGGDWDRKAFGIVAGLLLGCALALLLFSPSTDVEAALAAQRGEQQNAGRALTEAADALPPEVGFATSEPERVDVRPDVLNTVHHDGRVEGLIADLRADGIRGNGNRAMRAILELPPGQIPELEAALTSFDAQQRHYAAAVLRRRVRRDGGVPSPELLQASVDAMHSQLPVDCVCTVAEDPAGSSLRFLCKHTSAAKQMLLRAIDSVDVQQRLFSAYLLARARVRERASRVAYVLCEHLRDNGINGDALMATHGLYRLGESALPVMADARRYGDEQARKLIDLIVLDLEHPPRNKSELRARKHLHGISCLYYDPAIEYDIYRSLVSGVSN